MRLTGREARGAQVDGAHNGVDVGPPPANEAIVASRTGTVVLPQVAPWRT